MKNRVLLVEDSKECQFIIDRALSSEDIEVVVTDTVKSAMNLVRRSATAVFDLIILDLSLPDGEGFEILNEIKSSPAYPDIPVFFLTRTSEVEAKVNAFNLGADDYLVKPVSPLELRARVKMRLKKNRFYHSSPDIIQRGSLILDIANVRASFFNGALSEDLSLTGKEFKILNFLVQHEGKTFSRGEVVKHVWGESVHVLSRTVDSHICGLRRKMSAISNYIENIPGVGYRFRVPD